MEEAFGTLLSYTIVCWYDNRMGLLSSIPKMDDKNPVQILHLFWLFALLRALGGISLKVIILLIFNIPFHYGIKTAIDMMQ